MANRKPPSKRPERVHDDTSRAIAKAMEVERPAKSGDQSRDRADGHLTEMGRGGRSGGHFTPGTSAPTISTKRPKQPGS